MSWMQFLSASWGVFLLYAIPVGGGIPAGTLLAAKRGLGWPAMLALYFLSDVLLACVFEPVVWGLRALGRRSEKLGKVIARMRESMRKSAGSYGSAAGPLALILIAFGVDPMTGRTAAAMAGHGFLSGWTLAITGDMFYFALIAYTTLKLGAAVNNDVVTTVIMLGLMMLIPWLLKRFRGSPEPA